MALSRVSGPAWAGGAGLAASSRRGRRRPSPILAIMVGSFSGTCRIRGWRDDVTAITSWSRHGIASYNPGKTAGGGRGRGGEAGARRMGGGKEKKKPKKEKKK